MLVKPIKTRKFWPPKDDLWELFSSSIKGLKENTVVAVASKIVSIGEGRCVPAELVKDKDRLVRQEAEKYLPRKFVPSGWVMHTLKNNIFIPSAGIDESNANGYYILWPKDPAASARMAWNFLRKKFGVKNLGVVITDSHSVPLRRGVVGLSLAHWGFTPLRDYRGQEDIFGRVLLVSQTNLPDSLAAVAVLAMGEGNEQTPIALVTDIPGIEFTGQRSRKKSEFSDFAIKPREDIYKPFLYSVKWRKGGGGYR